MSRYEYDVVVIGGGAAGLTASGMAASLGAKTALIESARSGGDCTWYGCVPSKALLKVAHTAHQMRTATRYGLPAYNPEIDFAQVMESVREIRQSIYVEADSPEIIRSRNVNYIQGHACFTNSHTIAVEGGGSNSTITSRYVVIATGSRPIIPEIPGLMPHMMLTNETLFEQDTLPKSLIILGGGPIGIEMAQALQRLGSAVIVIERGPEILAQDEPACTAFLRNELEEEGVRFLMETTVTSVSSNTSGTYATVVRKGQQERIPFDKILVAVGRSPNLNGLGLEQAGVAYGDKGIAVNTSARTNISHIYACGDVAEGLSFTHVAENMAKTAISKMLLKIPASYEQKSVPWVTFTDPELAHLGKTSAQLKAKGTAFETITFPYGKIDRAITDRTDKGLVVVHMSNVFGTVYGVHIVGAHAGEMINEFALAMKNRLTLRDISNTLHAYPTYLLGVRRTADQWYIRKGSPTLLKILGKLFNYRGNVSDNLGNGTVV